MQFQLLPTSLALLALSHKAFASPAVSTVTISATAPATPTSTSYTSDSDFQSAMIAAHNFYRSEHNASALTWNDTSAKYAANWASKCNFKHSVSFPYSLLPLVLALQNNADTRPTGRTNRRKSSSRLRQRDRINRRLGLRTRKL